MSSFGGPQAQNMYAYAQIACSVIVVRTASHNNAVIAATAATTIPAGISWNSARTRPDPDFSQSTQAQQIAAIAGETLGVWGPGSVGVDLVCNATWSAGDAIMADGSGFGIVATTTNYYVGFAQTAGVVGALCPVDVQPGYKA